jgi:hypothetical protein
MKRPGKGYLCGVEAALRLGFRASEQRYARDVLGINVVVYPGE